MRITLDAIALLTHGPAPGVDGTCDTSKAADLNITLLQIGRTGALLPYLPLESSWSGRITLDLLSDGGLAVNGSFCLETTGAPLDSARDP